MKELRFDGRVAVVTGAGGGLGREHALLLSERGAAVVVNDLGSATKGGQDHDSNPADVVVEEILKSGGNAVSNSDSVGTREGGEAIINAALSSFGRLDIVVNNAGIIRNRTFLNIGEDELEPILDVHVKGCFFVTRPAYEHMKKNGYGRIVNTSSGSGLFGAFGQSAYAAAKAAIYGFTRTLAIEGARYGIHVNAIAPAALTRMTPDALGEDSVVAKTIGLSGSDLEAVLGPHQVAPAVAYLAHETCNLNGETLSVGGGRVARTFMSVTRGIHESELSAEKIGERIEDIFDDAECLVPANVDEEIILLKNFLSDTKD